MFTLKGSRFCCVCLRVDLGPHRLKRQEQSGAAPKRVGAQLRIGQAVATPLTLTAADLKSMHRTTVKFMNPHDKKSEVYEGVLLEELLQKAGAPHGELRGKL